MANEVLEFEITELRLGLPGGGGGGPSLVVDKNGKKRVFSEMAGDGNSCTSDGGDSDRKGQTTKNQVVGWPPVCSYRKKNSLNEKSDGFEASKMYVKVSMDGAPFLRKIDMSMHKGYADLALALEMLFGCFGNIGEYHIFFKLCQVIFLIFDISDLDHSSVLIKLHIHMYDLEVL